MNPLYEATVAKNQAWDAWQDAEGEYQGLAEQYRSFIESNLAWLGLLAQAKQKRDQAEATFQAQIRQHEALIQGPISPEDLDDVEAGQDQADDPDPSEEDATPKRSRGEVLFSVLEYLSSRTERVSSGDLCKHIPVAHRSLADYVKNGWLSREGPFRAYTYQLTAKGTTRFNAERSSKRSISCLTP